ncbi:MAG: hypothetical protein AB7T10_02825 [bacterium]
MVNYADRHSKFFNRFYAGHDINDFESLPLLTKEEILDFCLEIEKTRDYSKWLRGINISMSSGTSGNKGVEIVTPREEMYMKAVLLSRFDIPKGKKMNVAFILRVSAPAFSLEYFGLKLFKRIGIESTKL